MRLVKRAAALLLTAVLAAGLLALPAAAQGPAYRVDTTVTGMGMTSYRRTTELSKAFAVGAGVLGGDGRGNLNWDKGLTRAEATVMVIRLMGLEEEAKAAAQRPSVFSDAPGWAQGYLNLAHERGVSKGVGNGRFDPDGPCGAQEFFTMLFRLTHLQEGTDYAWATAVEDFRRAVAEADTLKTTPWYPDLSLGSCAGAMAEYIQAGGTLTRAAAADGLYLMLSIQAGPGGESLADILAEEYGMSDMLLYDCTARRTGHRFRGRSSLTLEALTGPVPTVIRIQDGSLYVDDTHGPALSLSLTCDGVTGGESVSGTGPVPLPRASCHAMLSYLEPLLDADGTPTLIILPRTARFEVCYADGTWTLSPWALDGPQQPEWAFLYAYSSESHWARLQALNAGKQNPEAQDPKIQALAAQLTAGKSTGLAKAEAISAWVATHIYYDYPVYRHTAQGVAGGLAALETRKGVCANYTALTEALMQAAGLECYTENKLSHAWTVARLDGTWTVLDSTWDSPLRYEYQPGGGWEYMSIHPASMFEWFPSQNRMEPEGVWNPTYFNEALDWFYRDLDHCFFPDPIVITRETTNISQIALYER